MLCDSCCAVTKEFCYHFQAYSSVQAPGSIGVSGNVGKDRFINATEVSYGFQIDCHLVMEVARSWIKSKTL